MRVALIVPVKSFAFAKGRLATTLTNEQRSELARECATTVLRAGMPWPTYVICDNDDVAKWGNDNGAIVVRCLEPGIDAAVRAGRTRANLDGADHVVVAHSDLPLAHRFDHLVLEDTITFVPDRRLDGTNVIAMPTNSPFITTYGPDSFARHTQQANDLGVTYQVVHDDDLALDLDTADDLTELQQRRSNKNVSHERPHQ